MMNGSWQDRKDIDRVITLLDGFETTFSKEDTVKTLAEVLQENYYDKSEVYSIEEMRNVLLEAIYPVGSIYISVNSTSPADLFGGEWEQIEDTFLLSAGTNYQLGDTGGSKDAVVVEHTHTAYTPIYNQGSQVSTDSHHVTWGSHGTSDLTVISTEGEDGTDKNMPPYLVVNVWYRTE